MRFCPYAQRALIVLAAKNVKYETVNINLRSKPEWFFDKSPLGKVPSLEVEGEVLSESLVICDYLDEAYPDPPLHPTDPWKKGQDKMFVEVFNKVIGPFLKIYIAKGDQKVVDETLDDMGAGLDTFEAELKKRNTNYYCGATPGMLDYMIWPWMERMTPFLKLIGKADFFSVDRYPNLNSWMELMKEDDAVKAFYLPPETYCKYMQSSFNGSPDHDMLV